MNSREIIQRLKQDGWELVRTKGDHHVFRRPDGGNIVVVPHPKRDLPTGTLRSIFRQAGWDWNERS